jgi:hypothetical protein
LLEIGKYELQNEYFEANIRQKLCEYFEFLSAKISFEATKKKVANTAHPVLASLYR